MLEQSGCQVLTASSGERALLILREEREGIDWLVSKASLPGLVCGSLLADEYQSFHPRRPAILLTDPFSGREGPSKGIVSIRAESNPSKVLDILQGLGAVAADAFTSEEPLAQAA
jgi:CheY-like chemotaxis protein